LPDAIGIFVEVGQGHGLGADVAGAERVGRVAGEAPYTAAVMVDGQPHMASHSGQIP